MEFNELILARRSMRSYDASKCVTKEQVAELMEAVHLAPTWKNSQTGRYYAALSGEALESLRATLPSFNQKNSEGAALIVTTFVKDIAGFNTDKTPTNEAGNLWGAYDLGLQNAYLVLKAKDMGLDTLIMGIRDEEAIRKFFNISDDEIIMAVISVGYAAAPAKLSARKSNEEILTIAE